MAQISISMLYAASHWTLLDRSKVKLLAVGWRAGDSQADSDLLQPSHESSSRSSCLTPSKTTAGFQQAELFVTKQIVTNLRDKYRIARPPCFNLSFFCLLFR